MTASAPLLRAIGDKTAEPYQDRIMRQIADAITQNRSGAILAPTGSGKSLMAAAAVEDALNLSRPVLVLHPDVNLLRQNLAQFQKTEAFSNAKVSAFIARNEKFDDAITRNDLSADAILASNMSMVNKLDDPAFIAGLQAFGRRQGVVIIDEGQKAAADKLSEVLEIISDAGGMGIVLTATPFRTDGQDPLSPFGASIEDDMIGVAEFHEVLKTGRIVKTIFDIASTEFENEIGEEATHLIESAFLDLLRSNKSIEQASQGAFARFFKNDASGPDKAIGELIVKAVTNIWSRRAATANIAMIHCDSVAFAESLASYIATIKLPYGHPRASQYPNVGFVVASETTVYRNGAAVSCADLGWTIGGARESILDAARAGKFDILVNVNALGVGTDIPATDLNILACRARSVGPTKQISGRGERSYTGSNDNVKENQSFIDIGSSIYEIYRDIDAMRRGDPERSRRHIRELSPDIRRQFESWFDADPDLAAKIRRRHDVIHERATEDHEACIDELDDSMRDSGVPRTPAPFVRATLVACKSVRAPNRSFFDKTALYINLEELGVLEPAPAHLADAARWLTIVHNSVSGTNHSFLSSNLENATLFSAFYGVTDPPDSHPRDILDAPSDKQLSYVHSLVSNRPVPAWANPAARNPETKSIATGTISLWQPIPKQPAFPIKWLWMLEEGSRHMLCRALHRNDLEHPIRAIALDHADDLNPEKIRLIAGAAKLRSFLAEAAPNGYDRPSNLSVISYDPTIGPEIPEKMRKSGARFTIIDDSVPETAKKIRDYLSELIGLGRIVAISPSGNADAWLRGKANLPRKDEAARAREKTFRDQLGDLLNAGTIELTATELEDVRKALTGRKTAPVGAFVAALLRLLPPAALKKATDIDGLEPPHRIELPIGALCAGYAQSTATIQKDVLTAADRLIIYKDKLNRYSRSTSSPLPSGKLDLPWSS